MRRARPWLARLSLLCAGLLVGAAANAGNIRGNWDPSLGGIFSGTGFSGAIEFFVPDACLVATGYVSNSDPCSNGDMELISLEVTLYEDTNPLNVYSVISFDPNQSPNPIRGVLVDIGASPQFVVELDTDPIGPKPSGASIDFAPPSVFMQFFSGEVGDATPGVRLYASEGCTNDGEGGPWDCGESDFRSDAATVAYSAVPEPGTLAMFLSGIGVGWLARRRMAAR
jgi:hypothetical protein